MTTRKLEVVIAGDADGLAAAFDKAADMGRGFGDKLSSAMKAGGVVLAAGGAAMGALAVKGFMDGVGMQADQAKFAAQLGLDPEEAERLGGIAGDLYANAYGESLGEMQDIVRGVVAGVNEELSDVELSNLSAQVADVATAFDQDFNSVIKTAQGLVNNGLVPDFESALDVITKGFQTIGPQGADEFLDTLNEYSDAFEQLGIDGPTAIALIEKGLENGAFSVDKIGDAFKEFSLRAIEDSENVSAAYADLGLNADEFRQKLAEGGPAAKDAMSQVVQALASVEDPIERNRLGVEFFGTQWEDLGESVVLGLDPAKAAVEDLSQVTENMGNTLNDNLMVKWETFKRQGLMAMAEIMVNNVIPAVEKGVEWITKLADVFRNEGFEAGIRMLADEAGKLAGALKDKLGEAVPVVVEKLKELAAKFADWVIEATPPMLARLGELLGQLGQWVTGTALPALADKVGEWAKAFTAWVAEVVPPLLSQLDDLLASISSWIREKGLPALGEKLKEWVPAFAAWAVDVVPEVFKNLGELMLRIQQWIATEAAPAFIRELGSWVLAFVQWIGEAHVAIARELPGVAQAVVDWAKQIPGQIVSAIGDVGSLLLDKGRDVISGLLSGIASIFGSGGGGGDSTVSGFMGGVPGKIVSAIGDVLSLLVQKGKDIIAGLLSGIGQALVGLMAMVAGIPVAILNAFAGIGPTTLFSKGADLVGGLISGITSKIPFLGSAVSAVTSVVGGLTGGGSIGQGIKDVVTSVSRTTTSSRSSGLRVMASAGVVPGRIGELVPILAHGGEEIRPLGSTRANTATSSAVFAPTINLHGPATLADANRMIEALNDWADVHGPIPISVR